jgi:hypothetical protein
VVEIEFHIPRQTLLLEEVCGYFQSVIFAYGFSGGQVRPPVFEPQQFDQLLRQK